MARARIAAVAATWCVFLWPFVAAASADWLITQQRADGSIASTQDVAATAQSTAESIRALRLAGRAESVGYAVGYLLQQQQTNGAWLDLEG